MSNDDLFRRLRNLDPRIADEIVQAMSKLADEHGPRLREAFMQTKGQVFDAKAERADQPTDQREVPPPDAPTSDGAESAPRGDDRRREQHRRGPGPGSHGESRGSWRTR